MHLLLGRQQPERQKLTRKSLAPGKLLVLASTARQHCYQLRTHDCTVSSCAFRCRGCRCRVLCGLLSAMRLQPSNLSSGHLRGTGMAAAEAQKATWQVDKPAGGLQLAPSPWQAVLQTSMRMASQHGKPRPVQL